MKAGDKLGPYEIVEPIGAGDLILAAVCCAGSGN